MEGTTGGWDHYAHEALPERLLLSPSTFVAMRPGHGIHFGIDPATAAVFYCPQATLPKVTVALQRATRPIATSDLINGLVHAGLAIELAMLLVEDLVAYGALQPPPRRRIAILGRGSLAVTLADTLRLEFPLTPAPATTSSLQFLAGLDPGVTVVVAGATSPVLRQALRLRQEVWPVDIVDGTGVIGPVVRGGQGPCATCVDLHTSAGLAYWEAISAQRPIRPRRNPLPELAVATRLAALLGPETPAPGVRNEPLPTGTVIELNPYRGNEQQRILHPHPHCPVCHDAAQQQEIIRNRQRGIPPRGAAPRHQISPP